MKETGSLIKVEFENIEDVGDTADVDDIEDVEDPQPQTQLSMVYKVAANKTVQPVFWSDSTHYLMVLDKNISGDPTQVKCGDSKILEAIDGLCKDST